MGCDIHGWVEVKHNGKYIAIAPLLDDSRNYDRFCALAGVRCRINACATPRGIPDNISDTAKYDIDRLGSDVHSHSYLPLEEAAKIFLDTNFGEPHEIAKKYPEYAFFGYDTEEMDSVEDVRLVFWFDN